jgi:hypothetical protein
MTEGGARGQPPGTLQRLPTRAYIDVCREERWPLRPPQRPLLWPRPPAPPPRPKLGLRLRFWLRLKLRLKLRLRLELGPWEGLGLELKGWVAGLAKRLTAESPHGRAQETQSRDGPGPVWSSRIKYGPHTGGIGTGPGLAL